MQKLEKYADLQLSASSISVAEMAAQFPIQITASHQNHQGEIRIDGVIYDWDQDFFRMKVSDMLDAGVKDVDLYINSPGGDVFAANQIVNEMERFEGQINGKGGAVIASAASLIAINCDTFEMGKHSQFMYHKPKGNISGNEDEVKAKLKLLSDMTSLYRKLYAEKTGKTEDEIEEAWSKGDVWLTAEEAVKEGFATSIRAKKEKITETQALMIAACGSPFKVETSEEGGVSSKKEDAAQEFNKSENQMKNKDAIIAKLKLPKDATDQQIEAALDELQEKATQAETLSAQAETQMNQAIEAMVDQAIMVRKIKADQKEQYVALAKKDFENTRSILESIEPIEKISGRIGQGEGEANRANWTMQDYIDKDLKALEKMEVEEPQKFVELMEAHYSN